MGVQADSVSIFRADRYSRIMDDPRRNDPCPCGSGKKYKHCHMNAAAEFERLREHCMDGMRIAVDWLGDTYEQASGDAISEQFYAALEDEDMEKLEDSPVELFDATEALAEEWLLAEGAIAIGANGDAVERRAHDLVLESGGPALSPAQRAFIEELGRRPTLLYEIAGIGSGSRVTLRDRLFADRPPLEVYSRSLAAHGRPGDRFLLRIVMLDGTWCTSGTVCPVGPWLQGRIEADARALIVELGLTPDTAFTPDSGGATLGDVCRDLWLLDAFHPVGPPQIADRATGEPLLLVNDFYDVLNWTQLAERLAAKPDVEGDAADGWKWLRPAQTPGGLRSIRWALNRAEAPDRLLCFGRTLRAADEGREWLEALAGDCVRHLGREVIDPRSPAALEEFRRRAQSEPADPLATLSPEQRRDVFQEVHHKLRARWADEPIPVLGNRTPREAVTTPAGRAQVEQLLRDYEAGEARRASAEQRPPVDMGFLWRSVGLEPAAPV